MIGYSPSERPPGRPGATSIVPANGVGPPTTQPSESTHGERNRTTMFGRSTGVDDGRIDRPTNVQHGPGSVPLTPTRIGTLGHTRGAHVSQAAMPSTVTRVMTGFAAVGGQVSRTPNVGCSAGTATESEPGAVCRISTTSNWCTPGGRAGSDSVALKGIATCVQTAPVTVSSTYS